MYLRSIGVKSDRAIPHDFYVIAVDPELGDFTQT